jgi:hypothetical protein
MRFSAFLTILLVLGSVCIRTAFAAEPDPFTKHEEPPIVGRWDLKVRDGDREYPSWLEVRLSGFRTLVGSYVGQFGSARPIAEIPFDQETGTFHFVVPPQWERRTTQITFQGKLDGELLHGETTNDKGTTIRWEGRRAPSLDRTQPPKWGEPIKLFNGRDLSAGSSAMQR